MFDSQPLLLLFITPTVYMISVLILCSLQCSLSLSPDRMSETTLCLTQGLELSKSTLSNSLDYLLLCLPYLNGYRLQVKHLDSFFPL